MGARGLLAVLERLRTGDRGRRRADDRGARPDRRSDQPRAARAERLVRLAGPAVRAVDHALDPRERSARRGGLGHGDGPGGRAFPVAARQQRTVEPRVLHFGPVDDRGVLHARGDRQGRDRHPAHGRQHPLVHVDRSGGVRRDVRLGRPAGLVYRRRPLRRAVLVRAQRGRDADGAVGPDAGPARGARPAAAGVRGPAADQGRRAGARAPGHRERHQHGPRTPPRSGPPRSAASTRTTFAARPRSSAPATGCCPPARWASTSPTRPRPRPAR